MFQSPLAFPHQECLEHEHLLEPVDDAWCGACIWRPAKTLKQTCSHIRHQRTLPYIQAQTASQPTAPPSFNL